MTRSIAGAALSLSLLLCAAVAAPRAEAWTEGQHYFRIEPAQPYAPVPGKVEVTEVFSYACPACNRFYPVVDKIKAGLPSNAVMDYLPASFRPDEDWPVFQRAYFTAQALGVAAKLHDQIFDAVWESRELGIEDTRTHRIKDPPPSIEDLAAFYAHKAGVDAGNFVSTAKSFAVDVKMRQADEFGRKWGVDATPTVVVDGKYRVTVASAGGYDQIVDLVQWLVAQESASQ
jgi:protein dithiol oxidoreductase (disulfide-forming)